MFILLMCLTTTDDKFSDLACVREINIIVTDVLQEKGAKHRKRATRIRKQLMSLPPEELRQFFILNRFPVFEKWQTSHFLVPPIFKELKEDVKVLAFSKWVTSLHRTRNIDWLFLKMREK